MLQAYVRRRRAFLIVDGDEGATVATIAASLKGKTGADAENSALYFPGSWHRILCQTAPPHARTRRAALSRACTRGPIVRAVYGSRPQAAAPH
jgi:hypothetical protein